MTTADAFLADIIANPADDTPRLIFADWLEDNGEPARAEFIRVQVALAEERSPRYTNWKQRKAREESLLSWHGKGWLPVLVGGPARTGALWVNGQLTIDDMAFDFRRGFVAGVRCPLALWLEHGPRLVREQPLERVTLPEVEACVYDADRGFEVDWDRVPDILAALSPVSAALSLADSLRATTWMRPVPFGCRQAAEGAISAAALTWARCTSSARAEHEHPV